jgi:type IV fimbrial biogenesis protein FimT
MKRQSGFNIIELMVTVAVFGVLLGVGVPGIQSYIYNSRLTTQINSFSTSLAHARSEAIKLNARVVVCLSSNGTTCDGYASGNTWNKGWIIFVDRNNNSVIDHGTTGTDDCRQNSTTDCVLTVIPAFPGTNTLTPAASVQDFIVYVGDGSVRCNTNADIATLESCPSATSYFTLCDFRGAAYAKGVAVSSTGRVSSISKTPSGSAFTCP